MNKLKEKKTSNNHWPRRRILAFLPLSLGGVAIMGRGILSYKGKLSGRKADHWEKIKD